MILIGDQPFPYQYEVLCDPVVFVRNNINTSFNHFELTKSPWSTKSYFIHVAFMVPEVTHECNLIYYFITDTACQCMCHAFQNPEGNLIIATYSYLNIDKRSYNLF